MRLRPGINIEAKKHAENIGIADRMEVMSAFVTLKDHKENFQNNTKYRLINHAKPQLSKVSSQMLKEINSNIRKATGLKQWKATADVLQ